MNRLGSHGRKTIMVVFIFLFTLTSNSVMSQTAENNFIEIDLGILGNEGSCDVSSDEYILDESSILPICFIINFQSTSNARLTLSVWSNNEPEIDLVSAEIIVTPYDDNNRIIPSYLLMHDNMDYGLSQLGIDISNWEPFSGDSNQPLIIADSHTLIVSRPDSNIIGNFLHEQEDEILRISQFASLEGVLSHSNTGNSSILVSPILTLGDDVISFPEISYSLRPGVTESRRVSFPISSELELGTNILTISLKDARDLESPPIWQQNIEVFVLEPFGQVSISHANWDVTSFDAQSMLGTFPGDRVKISLNMTNPGGLPASSIFWIHFYSENNCWTIPTGEIYLQAGESLTSDFPILIPSVDIDTSIESKISSSANCFVEEDYLFDMESIHVENWPVSVISKILSQSDPINLENSRIIPVRFNLTNLESRYVSNLEVSISLSVLDQELGSWTGLVSLDANETKTFNREISTPYCYAGDIDASIEVRDISRELVHNSISQNVIMSYFIKGEFDMSSQLMSSDIMPLGTSAHVKTVIHAEASNPLGCTLLIPMSTIFYPIDANTPSITDNSLLMLHSGESLEYLDDIDISISSGKYKISQHLINSFSNNSNSDDWIESNRDFAEVEVTPSDPELDILCDKTDIATQNQLAVEVSCKLESNMPSQIWVRIGSTISDTMVWETPTNVDPYDKSFSDFTRSYEIGSASEILVHTQALWDGEWVSVLDNPVNFSLSLNHPLDSKEEFSQSKATTKPAYPSGGEPFAIQFQGTGTSSWLDGNYQVYFWLDEDKDGLYYSMPPIENNLQIGESKLIEVSFESWPNTCGKMPYLVIAKDNENLELDRIEGYFDGCNIELPDLSFIDQIDLTTSSQSSVARIKVGNIGDRAYSPLNTTPAKLDLIIDGIIFPSGVPIPALEINEQTVLEVDIPISGFQEFRIIIDGEYQYSELNRDNNGLGWASSTGAIIFENDSDFDGLPNSIEESGYLINTINSRHQIQNLLSYLEDSSSQAPAITESWVYPSKDHFDSDQDGLSDYLEWLIGTDATNSDTDDDNYSDWEEYHSDNLDPLMIELESPSIEVWEPSETLIPDDSNTQSGFNRQHTREFVVEDRNIAFVSVMLETSSSTKYLPLTLIKIEGDLRYYSVTYEVPWTAAFSVIVNVTDDFDNGYEFEIANKDSLWDRASNKINQLVTQTLAGKIASPILGFITGLFYGLKEIFEDITGLYYILTNFGTVFQSLKGIIMDCYNEYFNESSAVNCPIDLGEIKDSLWESFIGISPYVKPSTANTAFLTFAAVGFLVFIFFSGSWAAKLFGKVRAVSNTVDEIATNIGRTTSAVKNTLSEAMNSGLSKVSTGIKGAIISKVPTKSLSKLNSVRASTTDVMIISKLVIKGKIAPGQMVDAKKLIEKARLNPSTYNKLISDPNGFAILKYKDDIILKYGNDAWKRIDDGWIKDNMKLLDQLSSGNPSIMGFAREKLHNLLSNERPLTIIKPDGSKAQLDAVYLVRNADGKVTSWGSRELKHSGDPLQQLRTDIYKKSNPMTRSARDSSFIESVCPPGTSFAKCYDNFIEKGLDPDTAEGFAGCLSGKYNCGDFTTKPDINDLDEIMKGIGCMKRPGKCKDIADSNWKKEIEKTFWECAESPLQYGTTCLDMPARETLDAVCPGNNLQCLKDNFPARAEDIRIKHRDEWINYIDSSTNIVGDIIEPLLDELSPVMTYMSLSTLIIPATPDKSSHQDFARYVSIAIISLIAVIPLIVIGKRNMAKRSN